MARSRSYGNGSRSASSGSTSYSSGSTSYSSGSNYFSSGTGSKSYSTERSNFKSKPSPKPANDKKTTPPAVKSETTYGGSNSGGHSSSTGDGFSWGFGDEMGRRFFEAIFGPRTIREEIVLPSNVEVAAVSAKDGTDKYKDYTSSCSISYEAFQDCLNVKGNDLTKCHSFMDSLFECKKSSQLESSLNF